MYARGWCEGHYERWRRHGDPTVGGVLISHSDPVVRILARAVENTETGCWEYGGYRNRQGYGTNGGRTAHSVVSERWYGPPPFPGAAALHSCDNPSCVNPEHLRWGSQLENMRDMVSRDRQARGTTNGRSKLTEAQVLDIYSDSRTQSVIAAEYGMPRSTVGAIKCGKSWAWLTGATGSGRQGV